MQNTSFDAGMTDPEGFKEYICSTFRKALDEGWIQAYYQPVIRTVTGMLCGAEALCRWLDPKYGFISPAQFIPVLEERGLISQLDLHMMELVCRDYAGLLKTGPDVVPVSINLSRKDFEQPGLVRRIDTLAGTYRIPRELLNIEITESAFSDHPEKLSDFISHFHALGFQVWMDDFGTAYSSLGALKDLNFDELKIDMSFLSTSTDKARSIVTAIVRMAKEIGIQTLAEGVETKEQYEFLRRIGCEKVQGFYFGKPMSRSAFAGHCLAHGIDYERIRWKSYYDALSRIDYQTSEPLCVIEDDGDSMKPLFTNDAYNAVLRRDGLDGIDAWMEEVNAVSDPVHAFHRQYANEQLRKLEGLQTITYPSGDHYMELAGRAVAHMGERYLYTVSIRYIQLDGLNEYREKAYYIQNLYYLCRDIVLFDLKTGTMYGIKSSDSSLPIGAGGKRVNLLKAVEVFAKQFTYPPDQARFLAFYDPATLRTRLTGNNRESLSDFFRSKTGEREYQWLLHKIMPIPKSDYQQLLAITMPVFFEPGFADAFLQEYTAEGPDFRQFEFGTNVYTDALLWTNMKRFANGMYFWKDRRRRFVGASQSFLDYYGFHSLQDIAGKTDEDMGWHIEPEAFRNDEFDVLERGKRIEYAQGKCIVHGQQRTILACKVPIYRDGKIIGLMGKFFDQEKLSQLLKLESKSESIDPVTGLLNTHGFSECLRDYLEELWKNNTIFTMFNLSIPEYSTFQALYGEEAGDALLKAVGQLLQDRYGTKCVIGRLTDSHFAILFQTVDPAQIRQCSDDIRASISMLRKAGKWPCAVTATIKQTEMNQNNASQDAYLKALFHVWTGFGNLV